MFTETAPFYDAIYGSFRDFEAEAAAVAAMLRARHAGARSVLDVGCGTAAHARCLHESHGFAVDGLDIDPRLLTIARAKLPTSSFFEADMADFELGRRFDAVLCLFSSIGYLDSLDRVTTALGRFRQHLSPGGIVIVEPWFEPGVVREGAGTERQAQAGDVRITRSGSTRVEGRTSFVHFSYRIEQAGATRMIEEDHALTLFTRNEMLRCFSDAGLIAQYESPGLSGRGLYVATSAEV